MAWWVNTVTGALAHADAPPGTGADFTGPFASQRKAEDWLNAHPPTGTGGGGGGGGPGGGPPGGGGRGGGGGFDGSVHGPVVAQWLATPLCETVPVAQAGDLVCWAPNAHMGIAISPTHMISALNPALGTQVTSIVSAHAGVPLYRRLRAAVSGTAGTGGGRPQNTARMLLGRFGWGAGQMPPLISLWTRESGWSPVARNPQSGALGIAQALGHGQADTAGTLGNEYGTQYGLTADQAKAANSGNVLQQIRWGLGYIKAVYGSPAAAEAHEQSAGWY